MDLAGADIRGADGDMRLFAQVTSTIERHIVAIITFTQVEPQKAEQ
jgi:hypothetical protein